MIASIFITVIPVLLFLALLLCLDSLKLVNTRLLFICMGWGIASAGICYYLNTLLFARLNLSFESYSNYIAPPLEEVVKFSFLLYLIMKSRVGFMIDGAIYGFSIGASFSIIENLTYVFSFSEGTSIMVHIIRGFGTAVMHGGATALCGILCMGALNRHANLRLAGILGILIAISFHMVFNMFIISPIISTIIILLILPLTIVIVFNANEKAVSAWLEMELDTEISIMRMISKGMFSQTRAGQYLVSIKKHFPAETVVDMYCYISLYYELSIKAKVRLMLKENDMIILPDPSIPSKLNELKALGKIIGRSGILAISPVLRMKRKDLWKLSLLE